MKITLYAAGLLVMATGLFLFSFKPFTPSLETVKTEGGMVSGSLNESKDIHIFKGIPFAAPPIGELRWKAPQPVQTWQGVRPCIAFGPSPMQGKPAPFSMWSEEFLIPKEPISEDCLYLNVWTGAKSATERRPVLVWIYGGGFISGGSAVPIYDGEAMAKKGVVFVSINYRVGVFGFFALPELTSESGHSASGNYGIMDQIASLAWVKKNIAGFGGDPDNVTIAGQSAGSMSVNCLVASPLAKDLFQKAIAESGASFTNGNASLQKAEQEGSKIMQSLNLSSLADLRKIPTEDLMKKAAGFRGPIIDGYVLPDAIVNIYKQGKENKVPLLTGWNQDEGLVFGPLKKASDFQKDVASKFGADSAILLNFYPADNDSVAALSQLRLARDQIFGVQNYVWANMQNNQGLPVFVYRFIRKPPATGEYRKYGAFHTAEVPYAYDNLNFVHRPWEAVDFQLATTMSSMWANFARTGNPNGKGMPAWASYDQNTKKIMMFTDKPTTGSMVDYQALDFLYKKMSAN